MISRPDFQGITVILMYAAIPGFALVVLSKIVLAVSQSGGKPSPNVSPNSEAPNDFRMFNWVGLLKFYQTHGFTRELLAALLFNVGVALFILPFLFMLSALLMTGEHLTSRNHEARSPAATPAIQTAAPSTKDQGSIKQVAQYISTKYSALLVGEAFLVSIYGKEVLTQRPFDVRSSGDSWILSGKLNCGKGVDLCTGGTARIEFSKIDGRIISAIHGK